MRKKSRIKPFLQEIEKAWIGNNTLIDWRFGQLLFNFFSAYGDPFYWEEDEFIQKFKEYTASIKL